jgi:hypothetical protein
MKKEKGAKLFVVSSILALALFLICLLFIRSELKFAEAADRESEKINSSYYIDNSSDPFISQIRRR